MLRDQLRQRLGAQPSDDQLDALLADAEAYIKGFTTLETLPASVEPVQLQLAVISYRRFGAEGETEHAEGGVSMRFDTDMRQIKEQLLPYRRGFVGLEREAGA